MENEKQKPDFGNLPTSASDYIKLIIKKMKWRKKVRQDVQAELIAHFEDALRDCKTSEEKEKTVKELIENFGDAKLVAVLARRAKKRCRPLWQKIFIRLCQFLFVIFCFFNLYILWFFTGKPNITTDYVEKLNQYVKPASVDDSQNAALYYNQAAKKNENLSKDFRVLFAKSYFECNEPEKKLGSEWLAENQEVLNLISEGSKKPFFWETYSSKNNQMLDVLIPNLQAYRDLARVLSWNSCIFAEQGKYSEAFENIAAIYKFGKHIKTGPSIVEQLIGIAIESLSTRNLRQILSRYDVGNEQVTKFQNEFRSVVQCDNFKVHFETEKWMVYDEIQRDFTEDIFGGHICFKHFEDLIPKIQMQEQQLSEYWKNLFYFIFFQPNKKETIHAVDYIYNYYEKISGSTPASKKNLDIKLVDK